MQRFWKQRSPDFSIFTRSEGHTKKPALIKPKKPTRKIEKKPVNLLSELEIVSDLLVLLQGGCKNKITFKEGKFTIDGCILAPHVHAVQQIRKIVTWLDLIDTTVADMKGVVGQVIGTNSNLPAVSLIHLNFKISNKI